MSVLAAILSLFMPGLGQLTNKEYKKAGVHFVGYLISFILTAASSGALFFLPVFIWIYSVIDAFKGTQVRTVEEKIKCPNCGTMNTGPSKFCSDCGGNLYTKEETEEEDKTTCNHCGKGNDKGSKYCMSCGKKIGQEEAAEKKETKTPPAREAKQKVLECIRARDYGSGVSIGRLQKYVDLDNTTLSEAIDSLIDSGKINEIKPNKFQLK